MNDWNSVKHKAINKQNESHSVKVTPQLIKLINQTVSMETGQLCEWVSIRGNKLISHWIRVKATNELIKWMKQNYQKQKLKYKIYLAVRALFSWQVWTQLRGVCASPTLHFAWHLPGIAVLA